MKIFISYRRDDSAGYAGRLFDSLIARFGANNIFMDIDTIPPGKDFRKVITDEVGKCDIALVLIGKQWLSMVDAEGHRRLDDPMDWVRVEIATALSNPRVRVIPVLVRDARMPGDHELPEELKELGWRNAIELSDSRFQHDTKKLIQAIEAAEAEKKGIPFVKRRRKPERHFPWWAAILIAVLGIFYLTLAYFPSVRGRLFPELTHTSIAVTSTVEPSHTLAITPSTSPQTAVVTVTPEVQTSTPLDILLATSVSSPVPVEPTFIVPTETNIALPVATTSISMTDCLELIPDGPYPTPIAQQAPRPGNVNYLLYESNFETLFPLTEQRTKDWAEYTLYWAMSTSFKARWESSIYASSRFIAPDNRQPGEGYYSICIEAPPNPVAPTEFEFLTQPLPAEPDTTLRLSFLYRTFDNPDVRVYLTSGGSYTGPFWTADGPSNDIPEPLEQAESWTIKEIDFKVDAEPRCRFSPFENEFPGRAVGCFKLRFLVGGTGIVWIDDVRVEEVP